ncbi:MAG: hypothetical protein E7395_02765 [Ruminococcaceae bacterium]|nr:hypothetical protein [Oscillospiraceae bacterium]
MKVYPYFDSHCDTISKMLTNQVGLNSPSLEVNLSALSAYKPTVQVFALYNDGSFYKNDVLSSFQKFKNECKRFSRQIAFKRSCGGIKHNAYMGRATALLAIEALGNQPDFSIDNIIDYHRSGVRIMSLCWNDDNILCGGTNKNLSGLTGLGVEVLKKMKKLKIILDVSHMSDKSFYEALQVYDLPMCATHSSSRSVCNHPRNLTDDQFLKIAARGGMCGINFYPPFLGGNKPGINQVIAHIEHFMALGGEDAIGIGADFDGTDRTACGLENAGLTYKLFDALLSLNYKESTVNKIAFYNFYKFLKNFEF